MSQSSWFQMNMSFKDKFTVSANHYRRSSDAYGECFTNPVLTQSLTASHLLKGPPSSAYLPISAAKTPGQNGHTITPMGMPNYGQTRTANQKTSWMPTYTMKAKKDTGFVFDILDADGDGRITRAEYIAGFDIIDTDHDGFITREEFGTESNAPFKLLDTDGDGHLTRAEYEAGFDLFDNDGDGFITRAELHGHVVPHFSFDALDADGDGEITKEEYMKAFDMIDLDKDGYITVLEFNCVSC